MGLLDLIVYRCNACGDFFPKSVLVTLSGYEKSGTYCTCCVQEIIEDEGEE
ncbi:hypothetical protein [Bacillus sp. UNC438CL73TsuS30]|uniref:hypothetical protein n=1 Tax=Bacillus sp. UNC438CL73TsuS30 TaxID=1340434 RepID=UPI0018CC690C|nr:hypothetical protein [Bacillus sp. UNC438CL73TsuS30]